MFPGRLVVCDSTGKIKNLFFSGKSGGEGAIYNIEGEDDFCAKIFFKTRISEDLHEKILTMVRYPPGGGLTKPADEISSSSIAWPSSPLYISEKGGSEFVGYEMPKIDTEMFREAHMYYDTGDRLKILGGSFSWHYLMTAAYNISFVVSKIHETGHCIGDFSPRNILVARTAAVSFIDCDSFQVCNPETGKVFYTKVGTGELLPPELMGRNFRHEEINRHQSDLFALGIIIFRLIMNGTHPYQAAGRGVWDVPTIEQKTIRGIYPYIPHTGTDIHPPKYAPEYDILPQCIRDLFSDCFTSGHADPFKRPSADEWCRCLASELRKLKRCDSNPHHWFSSHLSDCPWCKYAGEKGVELFPYTKPSASDRTTKPMATKITGPTQIKTCTIKCNPSRFRIRTDSGDVFKGRLELEMSGSGAFFTDVSVTPGSVWITDIKEIWRGENRRTFDFIVRPTLIPKMRQGIIYKGYILIRAGAETKKVTVEIGSSLKPAAEPSVSRIILRGIKLGNPPEVIFSIRNTGGGILKGNVETDRKWLKIAPPSFSTADSQEFRIRIEPDEKHKSLIHANIIVNTNGGSLKIPFFASESISDDND